MDGRRQDDPDFGRRRSENPVRKILRIKQDAGGAALVEFAFLAPVFIGMILAATQLSLIFFANAGLKNAISEGARLASLFPRPTNEKIAERIKQQRFGLDPAYLTGPFIVDKTVDGVTYAEITMTYKAPVNFVFYKVAPITLTQTRRVYTKPSS